MYCDRSIVAYFIVLPPVDMDYIDIGMLTVTIAAGTKNGAIVKAPLTILNDVIVEGTETIVIVGCIPAGVEASFAAGHDSVTLSICDNDGRCIQWPLLIA